MPPFPVVNRAERSPPTTSSNGTSGFGAMLKSLSLRSTVARSTSTTSSGGDSSVSPTREGRIRLTGPSSRGAGVKIKGSHSASPSPSRPLVDADPDLSSPSSQSRREGSAGQVLPGPSRGGFIVHATKSPPTVAASPSVPPSPSPIASTSRLNFPPTSPSLSDLPTRPFPSWHVQDVLASFEVPNLDDVPPPFKVIAQLVGLAPDSEPLPRLLRLLAASLVAHPFQSSIRAGPSPSDLSDTQPNPAKVPWTGPNYSPLQLYVSQSHLLDASSPPEVRLAVLDLMATCVTATFLAAGRLKPGERALYWDEVQRWAHEGRVERDDGEKGTRLTLPDEDAECLISILASLTNEGKELHDPEVATKLCDFVSESLLTSPPPSPLSDFTLNTPFTEPSSFSPSPRASALTLLATLHKHHKIPTPITTRAIGIALDVAQLQDEREVTAAIALLRSAVRLMVNPQEGPSVSEAEAVANVWSSVVGIAARIIGCDGLVGVVKVAVNGSLEAPPPARPSTLPALAMALMLDLFRSSGSATLKSLLLSLAATPKADTASSTPAPAPVLLLVGALRSIRVARLEQAMDEATSSTLTGDGQLPASLPLDLSSLWPSLSLALRWKSAYVDAEVTTMVEESLAATARSRHSSTDLPQQLSDRSARVTLQEWDMAVEVLSQVKSHIGDWEERNQRAWTWYAGTADGGNGDDDDADHQDAEATQFREQPDVLVAFSALLQRVFDAWRAPAFTGPSERVWVLLMALAPHLADEPARAVIEYSDNNELCLPSHPDWLERTQKIVHAFYSEAAMEPAHDSRDPRRVPSAGTRRRASQLLASLYSRVRHSENQRRTLVSSLLLPLLEAMFEAETDVDVVQILLLLLVDVARDVLPLTEAESAESGSPSLFDRVRILLTRVAKGSIPPVDRYAVTSNLKQKRGAGVSNVSRYHMDSSLATMRSSPSISAPVEGSSSSQGPSATGIADVSFLTVLALMSLFHLCLASCTLSASNHAIAVFRDLLSLLSPSGTGSSEQTDSFVPLRTRLLVLQWLVRLRADATHRVHWIESVDVSTPAAILDRLLPVASPELATEALSVAVGGRSSEDGGRPEVRGRPSRASAKDRGATRDPSAGRGATKSPDRSLSRSTSAKAPQLQSPGPPAPISALWSYPESLPFKFGTEVSSTSEHGLVSFDHNLLRHWTEEEDPGTGQFTVREVAVVEGAAPEEHLVVLPVSEYLRALLYLLQHEQDWELISYILCYLPEQLSNKHFACGPRAAQQIHALRKQLCDGLRGGDKAFLVDVTLPPGLKRAEVHATAYLLLSSLIAYRSLFSKSQQDDMVETFMFGLGNPRDTAKVCIHAIAMASFELRPSVTKHLAEIVRHLQKIISSATLGVHILELIAGVGQEHSLYANFTELDFQTVFGIALKYIQAHNDRLADDPKSTEEVEGIEYAFSQYVLLLAYYVIDSWYMSLRLVDRPKYLGFLTRRLVQANEAKPEIDEPTEVCFDMLARCAFANADPRPRHSSLDQIGRLPAAPLPSKSWIVGTTLVTVQSLPTPGLVEVTLRRASGVVRMLWELKDATVEEPPQVAMHVGIRATVPTNPEAEASDTLDESSEPPVPTVGDSLTTPTLAPNDLQAKPTPVPVGTLATISTTIPRPSLETGFQPVEPSFFVHQLTSPFRDASDRLDPPLALLSDPQTERSILMLDHVTVVDFHKVGVLYVGAGQTTEGEILRNTAGSQAYSNLISALGQRVRLKGSRALDIYAGGLDQEHDTDGKWAYIWDDDISQIVFHVATLMPTSLERDPQATLKKRHIGNDFVKVIFNDSDADFAFDTLPGEFNFVNIVIQPHTPAGNPWMAPGMTNNVEYFKVSMQCRPGMPEVGPLGTYKMVTGASLPGFVRQLSLHSNIFAQVYLASVGFQAVHGTHRVEYSSNWRQRLQQIKRLKHRTLDAPGQRDAPPIDLDPAEPWRVFTSWL